MAACGMCKKDLTEHKYYKVYTGITRSSTIHTGFKQDNVKWQTVGFKEHEYSVCESCYKKYHSVYPLLIWSPFVLIALFVMFSTLKKSNLDETCLCIIVPLGIAYYLNSQLINLEKVLVKKAVAEREKTDWKSEIALLPDLHLGYPTARKGAEIEGFTQKKYEKLKSQK